MNVANVYRKLGEGSDWLLVPEVQNGSACCIQAKDKNKLSHMQSPPSTNRTTPGLSLQPIPAQNLDDLAARVSVW